MGSVVWIITSSDAIRLISWRFALYIRSVTATVLQIRDVGLGGGLSGSMDVL